MESKARSLIHSTNIDWVLPIPIVIPVGMRQGRSYLFVILDRRNKNLKHQCWGIFGHITIIKMSQNKNSFMKTVVLFPKETQ